MKKQQSGFAVVELIVAVVLIAAVAGVGYYVWHTHAQKTQTTALNTGTSSPVYRSPSTNVAAAPQINTATDLNSAIQALNQADLTANSTDGNQLSTQASGF